MPPAVDQISDLANIAILDNTVVGGAQVAGDASVGLDPTDYRVTHRIIVRDAPPQRVVLVLDLDGLHVLELGSQNAGHLVENVGVILHGGPPREELERLEDVGPVLLERAQSRGLLVSVDRGGLARLRLRHRGDRLTLVEEVGETAQQLSVVALHGRDGSRRGRLDRSLLRRDDSRLPAVACCLIAHRRLDRGVGDDGGLLGRHNRRSNGRGLAEVGRRGLVGLQAGEFVEEAVEVVGLNGGHGSVLRDGGARRQEHLEKAPVGVGLALEWQKGFGGGDEEAIARLVKQERQELEDRLDLRAAVLDRLEPVRQGQDFLALGERRVVGVR